ncbi:hypothetical protein BED41_05400 [Cloacibacillus porcorum]|uniref:Uncharacterized protein n=1 Tax=Cloacibacillus porcorum TaxID=1197717 RepID=A0A1B2I3N5_9BACT|nr:hypothetical protein BED41_05400 [Cloacibacillus porcorum]
MFFSMTWDQPQGRWSPAQRPERQDKGKRRNSFNMLNDKLRFTKDFGALSEGAPRDEQSPENRTAL